MRRSRYVNIMQGMATLTTEEKKEWHFCKDWDGLLIHINDNEYAYCKCKFKEEQKKKY